MATTKYGNKYKTSEGTFQVYVTYSTSETATTYTITSTYHIKAITALKASEYVTYGMTYLLYGDQSGRSETKVPTMAKGTTKQIFSRTKAFTKGTSASGWQVEFSASNNAVVILPSTSNSSIVTASVTVPALASYKVSYNANGGSGAPAAQTKYYGKSLTLSATKPTRTGYTFKGWATSASGAVAYAPGAAYTANAAVTLYAIWQIDTYAVSYNANGGDGSIANQTKTYGQALTLSNGAALSRQYHTLASWNTNSAGTGTAYALGGSYTNNTAVTLYAQWHMDYVNPSITKLNAYRVSSASGDQKADDGENIKVELTCWRGYKISNSGERVYLSATLEIWIDGAIVYTESVTSDNVDVSAVFSTYNKDEEHNIDVILSDEIGTGAASAIISTAIYPIDLYGKNQDVYMGVMHTYVEGQELTVPDLYVDGDLLIELDTTATSGIDKELYDALVDLGWTDCIV